MREKTHTYVNEKMVMGWGAPGTNVGKATPLYHKCVPKPPGGSGGNRELTKVTGNKQTQRLKGKGVVNKLGI